MSSLPNQHPQNAQPPAHKGDQVSEISSADFINKLKLSGSKGFKLLKELNENELKTLTLRQDDV